MIVGGRGPLLMKNFFVGVFLILGVCRMTFAQSTFGVVLGTVRDSSGAVVAGATVRLTNTGENISRQSSTGGSGDYEFQNTKPGAYSVTVTRTGFQTFVATQLTLDARQ